MPIRPELRHFYRGPEWRATRERIRDRAEDCCEQCRKPNRSAVETRTIRGDKIYGPRMWWRGVIGDWHDHNGCVTVPSRHYQREAIILVVCTVAHLNHTPGDDRDENLKFLCQWCHLNYDKLHHKETRSVRKDAARPLLKEAV